MRLFRAIIARESVETDEGWLTRVFPAGCFEWGAGPWPVTMHHDDAALDGTMLGQIQAIERLSDLIIARGFLDDEGVGAVADLRRDVIRQIGLGMINSVSVEASGLDVVEECTEEDEDGFCAALRVTFTRYEIGVASVVTIPAIEGTLIELDVEEPAGAQPAAAVAAATAADDLVIPAAWLTEPDDLPDLDAAGSRVPIVTAEGRVYGWLCSFSDCHVSFPTYCQTPWRSPSGYSYAMHSGPFLTDEGERVTLAPLAASGGHYPTEGAAGRDWRAARGHYDDPETCAAYVAYGENERGIWFSGIARPDAPERLLGMLRRHQLSGDWRRPFGEWELMGACSVNQPGFVRRAAWAASASGELELVAAVVSSGHPMAAACECGGSCDTCRADAGHAGHSASGEPAEVGVLTEVRAGLAAIHAFIAERTGSSESPEALPEFSAEERLAIAEARLAIVYEFLEPSMRDALRQRLTAEN